jgi:hypothetical protein
VAPAIRVAVVAAVLWMRSSLEISTTAQKKGPRKGCVPGGQRTATLSGSDWTLVSPAVRSQAIKHGRDRSCIRSVPPASMPTGPLRGPQKSPSGFSSADPPHGSFLCPRRAVLGISRPQPHGHWCREAGEYGNRKTGSRAIFRAISPRIGPLLGLGYRRIECPRRNRTPLPACLRARRFQRQISRVNPAGRLKSRETRSRFSAVAAASVVCSCGAQRRVRACAAFRSRCPRSSTDRPTEPPDRLPSTRSSGRRECRWRIGR